jgi:hypothetical protein
VPVLSLDRDEIVLAVRLDALYFTILLRKLPDGLRVDQVGGEKPHPQPTSDSERGAKGGGYTTRAIPNRSPVQTVSE